MGCQCVRNHLRAVVVVNTNHEQNPGKGDKDCGVTKQEVKHKGDTLVERKFLEI